MSTSTPRMIAAVVAASAAAMMTVGAAPAVDVVSLAVPGRSNASPWIAAAGNVVAIAWGASSAGKSDVMIAVSRDGGQTFGTPVRVNAMAGEARLGGELPPRVAIVPRSKSGDPEMVVLWTARGETTELKAARSHDGGRTFDRPVALQSSRAAGDRGWPALALDHTGQAHAIWLDHRGMAAGRTAGGGHTAHRKDASHDGVAMAQKSGLYYAALDASGAGERELTKSVCYCCKTGLAVAPDGALYAAWRHVYSGDIRDIAFTFSRDGGRSFSPAARVSEDEWALNGCPDDGPAIAADSAGTIHVVWPTVLKGPEPVGALFHASTRDGRTFTPRTRIPTLGSLKPSHPQIVADRRGRLVVAWDEFIDGRRVAAARELRIRNGHDTAFGSVVTLAPEGPAMYPVLAATDDGLMAVWATGGEMSLVRARAVRLP